MKQYKYIFPYHKVKSDSSIVIYGAGLVGTDFIDQLNENNYCKVLFSVDRNHKQLNALGQVTEVFPPSKLLEAPDMYDYVVVAADYYSDSIVLSLKAMGIPLNKTITIFRLGSRVYSGAGEDVIVFTIFKLLGYEKFSYIDVGANDPYRNSNTAYLYLRGCRGICIEPNPDIINDLRVERCEDIVLNIGVGVEPGVLPYYTFKNNVYNTFSKTWAESASRSMDIVEVKQIQVSTMSQIIDKYNNGVFPDFLQIDVEGLDFEILNNMDLRKSSPKVICAEVGDDKIEQMNSMLTGKGYSSFYRTTANMIYLRKDITELLLRIKP